VANSFACPNLIPFFQAALTYTRGSNFQSENIRSLPLCCSSWATWAATPPNPSMLPPASLPPCHCWSKSPAQPVWHIGMATVGIFPRRPWRCGHLVPECDVPLPAGLHGGGVGCLGACPDARLLSVSRGATTSLPPSREDL
jgi:hypothetical protein